LCIELKSKTGRLTETQKEFLADMEQRGWMTAICRSIDEVILTMETYFSVSKAEAIRPKVLISMN
jgi:hypothetical protein